MAGTDLTPEGRDDMSRPKGFDDYEVRLGDLLRGCGILSRRRVGLLHAPWARADWHRLPASGEGAGSEPAGWEDTAA